jgi:hypothetical protein
MSARLSTSGRSRSRRLTAFWHSWGYLGVAYANPNVDESILAPEPALDKDAQKQSADLIPFIPRRAKTSVHSQALDWAA